MLQVQMFTLSPFQENTYILFNEQRNAIVIDPGCYFTAEETTLQQFITNNGLTVVQLLQTHCHLDHVFGSRWVYNTFKTPMYLHPEEEKMLAFAPQSGQKYGLSFTNYNGPLHFLNEGDSITLDQDELTVLFTPGHSPGSISFYCPKQHFIISGDVLFQESIGRTDLPFGNFNVLQNSIQQQLYTLPNETIVYSGHGNPTTIGHEKQHNPYVKAKA